MLFLRALAVLCVWTIASQCAVAQDFILENPANPMAASAATLAGGELLVVDAKGRRFVYTRRPDLDSKDGQLLAYYNRDSDQFIRWPARNIGTMEIGRIQVGVMVWTESKMQIRRAGGPSSTTYIPGSPLHLGTLVIGPDRVCVAQIDASGTLQFFMGHGERWRHLESEHPPGLFVPGAPVDLVEDSTSRVPRVYTISTAGRLVEVIDGRTVNDLPFPPEVLFPPGGHFETVLAAGMAPQMFVTDNRGRLWKLDLSGTDPPAPIESKAGILEPGSPLQVLRSGFEVIAIDRSGAIIRYSQDPLGAWNGPEFLADGFVSRGHVTAWNRPGSSDVEIAAVDRAGRLQVLRPGLMGWTQDTLPGIVLPPGTPVTAFATSAGLSLTAVLADGRWVEFFENATTWTQRPIGSGFPLQAPLSATPLGPMIFASDLTGRLIAALWAGTEWRTFVCVPGYFTGDESLVAPRLISRKLYTNRPLNAAVVTLRNTTQEELVLRINDRRVPGKVEEIRIAPQSDTTLQADRDAGGTLEEVYLVPGPVGPVEEVRQIPLPPKQFYDVVVYANRVTYRYVDKRKQKGPVPNFEESSLTSIGAFPLTPGGALSAGTVLDVFQIASAFRNPGAAPALDPVRQLP